MKTLRLNNAVTFFQSTLTPTISLFLKTTLALYGKKSPIKNLELFVVPLDTPSRDFKETVTLLRRQVMKLGISSMS